MNNLSSYCGLVDAKIRASDKDLPVSLQLEDHILAIIAKKRLKNPAMPRTMKGPTQVKKHILVYIVTKSMLKKPMARNMKGPIEVKHHILVNIVAKSLLDPTKPGRMKKGYI